MKPELIEMRDRIETLIEQMEMNNNNSISKNNVLPSVRSLLSVMTTVLPDSVKLIGFVKLG